jgi:hypothetical protein
MIRLLLILAIAAALYYLAVRFVRAPPAAVASLLRKLLWTVAIGAVVVLAATGRLNWLFALIGAVLLALARLLPALLKFAPLLARLWRRLGGTVPGAGSPAGARSTVAARFVRMWLDHDSGAMGGEILEGRLAGRPLDDLALGELLALRMEWTAVDGDSAALIETYLDRRFGVDWRDHATRAEHAGAPSQAMSEEEARAVLGLEAGCSPEDVVAAHRRLIQKLHPDRGGSGYLAAKINQAKDVLLKR